jgi:tungstate transport system substrate-binding protein
MGRALARILLAVTLVVAAGRLAAAQQRNVILATTTSVRDAGLLEALLPRFRQETGYNVKVIAVGSGQAMELGRRGEADVLILHDPAGEERFVADGYGVERRALMHNEFVLVGPPDDPARVRGLDVVTALRRITDADARFISRGDRSGTHARELRLWTDVGVSPHRERYVETGQGMGATLLMTSELRGYALTDIATFLAHQFPLQLEILVEGDSALLNPYDVILANPERFSHVNAAGGAALSVYLLSPETQQRISEFRREELGRSVFVPDGNDGGGERTVEDGRRRR